MASRTWILGVSVLFLASCTDPVAPDDLAFADGDRWQRTTLGDIDADVIVGDGTPSDGYGRPALIILHGCAQSASDIVSRTNLADVADAFDAVVVVPSVPDGGVYAGCWDYYGSSHSRTSSQRRRSSG